MVERRESWPGPEYHITQRFRAPLGYVYRWCTNFSKDDARLEKEPYSRSVVSRSPKFVVFEDLEKLPRGWSWAKFDVTLSPPDRWHMESVGNRRRTVADYRLREIRPGLTELDLRFRRRPGLLPFVRQPQRKYERLISRSWKNFAAALERDYRRSRRSR